MGMNITSRVAGWKLKITPEMKPNKKEINKFNLFLSKKENEKYMISKGKNEKAFPTVLPDNTK